MKELVKQTYGFSKEKVFHSYLRLYYKIQIKKDFLRKQDTLDSEFKQEIQEYWNKFNIKISLDWHKWYSSRNLIADVRYIPEPLFYCYIEPYYNKVTFNNAYTDKSLHNIWFPNVKRPKTIVKNMSGEHYDDFLNLLSVDEVIERCSSHRKLIVKPTIDSGGGRGITFIEVKDRKEMEVKIIEVLTQYQENFVIQELIEQHPDLKIINPQSVNTLRVISFLYKGKVNILSSILRMGINSAKLDNETSGGISCGISNEGKLKEFSYDRYGIKKNKHPQGYIFKDKVVPSYNKVIEIIKEEHIKFGHFKIVSWDFAIDIVGEPILIEYNLKFQGLNFHQMDNGPLFGDLTDEILEEVFGK